MKTKIKAILAIIVSVLALMSFNSVFAATDELNVSVTYTPKAADETVEVKVTSLTNEFADTKSTWSLSADKKTYTKIYSYEVAKDYKTTFKDVYGNTSEVTLDASQLTVAKDFKVTVGTATVGVAPVYDTARGTTTITVKTNNNGGRKFKPTKSSWKLIADGVYEKTYNTLNVSSYKTSFVDEYGNIAETKIEAAKGFTVTANDATANAAPVAGAVTVTASSNGAVLGTLPSGWTIVPNDSTKATKTYYANTVEKVTFTDVFGDTSDVDIKITGAEEFDVWVDVANTPAADGSIEVTVTPKNEGASFLLNSKGEKTKTTWELATRTTKHDNTALTPNVSNAKYTKKFYNDVDYKTTFTDSYGNKVEKEIKVEGTKAFDVDIAYDKKADGTVEVTVTPKATISAREFLTKMVDGVKTKTKTTWELTTTPGATQYKEYKKSYANDTTYTTTFTDSEGNKVEKEIKVEGTDAFDVVITEQTTELDGITPITDGSVILKATANRDFKDTKSTWDLSSPKVYTKRYYKNQSYKTGFQDKFGNTVSKTITVTKAGNVEVDISKGSYDPATNSVTVRATIKSGSAGTAREFSDTKSAWTLSSDKKTYTRKYFANQDEYTTTFVDANGNAKVVTIPAITEFVDFKLNKVSYQKVGSNYKVSVEFNKALKNNKTTWSFNESDKTKASKEYTVSAGDVISTVFTAETGETVKLSEKVPAFNVTVACQYSDSGSTKIKATATTTESVATAPVDWEVVADTDNKQFTREFVKAELADQTGFTDKVEAVFHLSSKVDFVYSEEMGTPAAYVAP